MWEGDGGMEEAAFAGSWRRTVSAEGDGMWGSVRGRGWTCQQGEVTEHLNTLDWVKFLFKKNF